LLKVLFCEPGRHLQGETTLSARGEALRRAEVAASGCPERRPVRWTAEAFLSPPTCHSGHSEMPRALEPARVRLDVPDQHLPRPGERWLVRDPPRRHVDILLPAVEGLHAIGVAGRRRLRRRVNARRAHVQQDATRFAAAVRCTRVVTCAVKTMPEVPAAEVEVRAWATTMTSGAVAQRAEGGSDQRVTVAPSRGPCGQCLSDPDPPGCAAQPGCGEVDAAARAPPGVPGPEAGRTMAADATARLDILVGFAARICGGCQTVSAHPARPFLLGRRPATRPGRTTAKLFQIV